MIVLYVLMGAVVGITLLVAMCLIAGLFVALLYELAPIIQAWDVNLSAPLWVTRWRVVQLPAQPPVTVCLCRTPVTDPEYFHTVAHGLPQFTKHKAHAMTFSLADKMALEAFCRKYGEHNIFVVYAVKE